MNKRNVRAFAFGIFVSVCILGIAYFSLDEKNEKKSPEITTEEAKAFLENDGYVVLTEPQLYELEQAKEAEKPPVPVSEPAKPVVTYKLKIKKGLVSHDIAEQLEKAEIIEDADEFENYLEGFGYSEKIQLGTFELNSKMTYKDIAKKITRNR